MRRHPRELVEEVRCLEQLGDVIRTVLEVFTLGWAFLTVAMQFLEGLIFGGGLGRVFLALFGAA